MSNKSKLRTYRVRKKELETEKYLEEGTAQQRRVMVMMRGGTNDLRIETGRYEKLEEKERICIFCENGEVQDDAGATVGASVVILGVAPVTVGMAVIGAVATTTAMGSVTVNFVDAWALPGFRIGSRQL